MNLKDMKILIVDDNEAQLIILREILKREGFKQLTLLRDPRDVVSTYRSIDPDLLLLDLHMPQMTGFEVMEALSNHIPHDTYFPILVLTADARTENMKKALTNGAKDFLTKPFDPTEVHLRINNLLEARQFYKQLRQQNETLEDKVRIRTKQIEQTQIEMLVRLAHAAEYRDDESGEHVWRVSHTSWLLSKELSLSPDRCDLLLRASRLHDVGKIGIPDHILRKPGKLTTTEFDVIKQHTTIGAKLLSGGESRLMKLSELIALTHHERWDGTGYPKGLQGKQIPIESRILAVADTFDALTHDRIHQKAMTVIEAINEIHGQSGKQFDPRVVKAFISLYERGELFYTGSSSVSPIIKSEEDGSSSDKLYS